MGFPERGQVIVINLIEEGLLPENVVETKCQTVLSPSVSHVIDITDHIP